MNYNERLVGEAGLDPDNPPVTWAETFEWHEKLTKFDDAGNLLQIGLDPFDAEGGIFAGNDGSFPSESWGFKYFDVDTGEFNLDHEKMVDIFETMGEFVRFVGPDNLAGLRAVEGQGTWGGAFNAEVQAMIIEGYWHPGETAHEKPEVSAVNRATWVPVPEERRGAKIQFGGGHMVLFFKDATNPIQDAFPVAEFLQSDIHCDAVFKTIGWLPAYKSYIQAADASAFPGLEFYFKSIDEATEMHNAIRNPITSFVGQTWSELREAVYRDEMTGKEAAAKFQEACEQEWEEAGFA
jgi:ABC-type glycerol-3-phosphate transport system substrate-binding protein